MSSIEIDSTGLAIHVPEPDGSLKRVDLPEGILAFDFRKIVAAAYQTWLSVGALRVNQIVETSGLSESLVKRILETEEFKTAIAARGVVSGNVLTPEQDLVIQVLSDPSIKGGLKTRLTAAGINFAKYRAWMKQPAFRARLENLQQGVLKELEGDMLVSLGEAAVNGDLNALKYSFEVTGKYNPAQQAAIDVRAVISQVLEIIQDEIKDPAVLARIGTRMQGVAIAPRPSELEQ